MKRRMTIWARTTKVLFLAIFSSFGTNTMAQTRIAVVSDIHVMAPDLLDDVKGTADWNTYYSGQRKMLEQSAGLFDQFVTTMATEAPDVLLITGDLTKDGEMVSHEYVEGKLAELKTALPSIKIFVIPGNHDFGEEIVPNDPTGTVDHLSSSEFASFYQGYGYGIDNDNNFVKDPNGSLSYVAEIATDLYLLAIDSHSSSVSEATLSWICDQAKIIRSAGKRVIAMMHHPLFPHITGANMFIDTYTVKFQPTIGDATTYETVRNALIAAGVNVILTGHFHTSDIAYDWNDNQANGIYDINTGSLISYPCDYRMLTLTDNTLSVATASLEETNELLKPTESGSKVTWKNWLLGRMTEKAKEKITGYDEPIKSTIADYAAKAYVIHAEGNENSSTDYNRSIILMGASGFPKYAPIFNSMLKDISNYVDGSLNSGHEDRTDDRTLSGITLTTLGPSSTLNLLDDKDNRTAINCYDGKKVTVTLTGRTFYKDNVWNTLCLPFSLTAEQINASLLAGADIRALSTNIEYDGKTTGFDNDNNALILNFTPKAPADGAVTAIEAGRPYIIKWASGDNITTDLTFTGVTIDKTMHNDGNEDIVTFRGTYAPQQFTDNDPSILLLGKDNDKSVLYFPQNTASLGAFRAYFQLADGYAADDPSLGVRSFVMNFGSNENATGIIAIGNSQLSTLHSQLSEWFTLDGRRLANKPTAKGLYIHAGRKVVIK